MYRLSSKPTFNGRLGFKLAVLRVVVGSLWLLAFAGLFVGGAAGAQTSVSSQPLLRTGLPFAIADFDGDSRPDLASVESGQTNFIDTEYWIQLRLSTAGWQSIRLVAPVGGLQIAARDVNGDEWLDLVVTTAWSNRPVAVYLNDGHGGFTHAEPIAFPAAFRESSAAWLPAEGTAAEAVGALPPSSTDALTEKSSFFREGVATDFIPSARAGFQARFALLGQSGRAPPSLALLF